MEVERPTMTWRLFRREGHGECGQRFSARMRGKHRAVKRSARDDDGERSPNRPPQKSEWDALRAFSEKSAIFPVNSPGAEAFERCKAVGQVLIRRNGQQALMGSNLRGSGERCAMGGLCREIACVSMKKYRIIIRGKK